MDLRFGRHNLLIAALAFLCLVGYTREYYHVFKPVESIHDVNQIYENTVWVHYVRNDGDISAGTGWAVGHDKDLGLTYISTAAHVVDHMFHGPGVINVLYWPKQGTWKVAAGSVVYRSRREEGDIAIIAASINLNPLPIATRSVYVVGDEILVVGVQNQAPPALVSLGYIKKIAGIMIYVDGWSWRGHSGGPIIHRKTNKVIGFITAFGTKDTAHASYTECSNYKVISTALQNAGIR